MKGLRMMNGKQLGAVIIFVAALAAYVLLATFAPGTDYRGIFVFAAVGAGWLGIKGDHEKTQQSIQQIEHNTNGVLSEKIRTIVREVLAEHDIEIASKQTDPAPSPPPKRRLRKPV